MEKHLNPDITSKKELAKKQRRKELIRFLCLLLFTNLTTYFLSYENVEVVEVSQTGQIIPDGYEKILISAELLVPFAPDKTVKVLDKNNKLICNKIILFSQQITSPEEDFLNQSDKAYFTIIAPIKCLSKLLTIKELKLVPLSYQEKYIAKRSVYEVVY